MTEESLYFGFTDPEMIPLAEREAAAETYRRLLMGETIPFSEMDDYLRLREDGIRTWATSLSVYQVGSYSRIRDHRLFGPGELDNTER